MLGFGQLQLSHLVYEVESLTNACDVFERLTSVRPAIGSRQEALGLHNAVVGLGGGRYLEFLSKSPVEMLNTQVGLSGRMSVPVTVLGVQKQKPRLATWCCDAQQVGISGLVDQLSRLPLKNFFPAEVVLMSRTPSVSEMASGGKRLIWRIAADKHRECKSGDLPGGGVVPFLVDWWDECRTMRPGLLAPTGCELVSLHATHPEPSDTMAVLRAMRAEHLMVLEKGDAPKLSAVIKHPKGQMVLE